MQVQLHAVGPRQRGGGGDDHPGRVSGRRHAHHRQHPAGEGTLSMNLLVHIAAMPRNLLGAQLQYLSAVTSFRFAVWQ